MGLLHYRVSYSTIEGCIRQTTKNPIMTKQEEMEKEIVLRQNAIKFCKQDDLREILKDNLILVQEELIKLVNDNKTIETIEPNGVQ